MRPVRSLLIRVLRLFLMTWACLLPAASAHAQSFAYVANSGSDTVSVIDTATNTVVATVLVGDQPLGVAITTPVALSPAEQSEQLIDGIGDLVDAGTLNAGQGNSLVKKLEGVLKQLASGKDKTAVNQLNAMLNQLDSLVDDGVLTPDEGQTLRDAVEAIVAAIENP